MKDLCWMFITIGSWVTNRACYEVSKLIDFPSQGIRTKEYIFLDRGDFYAPRMFNYVEMLRI